MIRNYDLNFSKFANLAGDLNGILIVAVDSDPLNGTPESKAGIRLGRPSFLSWESTLPICSLLMPTPVSLT